MKLKHTVLFTLLAAQAVGARTITVTTTADSGAGTLRAALASATNGDAISFALSLPARIILTSGELVVGKNLTILGPGPGNLAVDGNAASRVFHTMPGTFVSLSSLTITNGYAVGPAIADSGGGILNERAALTLSNCTVLGNSAGSGGGGILNDGFASLTIVNSSLSSNSALSGGAIYNNGFKSSAAVFILNSTLSGNSARASSGGGGGAIFSGGDADGETMVNIMHSTLIGNSAGNANNSGDGGAVYNQNAVLSIRSCTLSGNLAHSGNGGGIVNLGSVRSLEPGSAELQILDSTLSGNVADFLGGGILNLSAEFGRASVMIVNSTVSSNWARLSGGGICNAGGSGDGRPIGSAIVDIRNSTLSGNLALFGGGIFNENAVPDGKARVEIVSTILNAGALAANVTNSSGTIISHGYNLSSDDGGGFFTNTTDQVNTDPRLGPLQENGGSAFTHALLCGSPAIDKGRNFTSSFNDQRGNGFVRTFDDSSVANVPGGDGTDVGAFEVQVSIVDSTPPYLTCPANQVVLATSDTGVVMNYLAPGATDDCSAVTIACLPPTGSLFPVGTTTVRCTATDSSGNQSSCTFAVHVKGAAEQISDLTELVPRLGLPLGQANSLIVKLQAALGALDGANVLPACGILNAFLNEVNAQNGKKRPVDPPDLLITEATRIRAVLNCPREQVNP